jgi:hypothetical protein
MSLDTALARASDTPARYLAIARSMSPRPLLDAPRDERARADDDRKNRPSTTERTARSPVVRLARARVDLRTTRRTTARIGDMVPVSRRTHR